jgi:hypothetical protein
MAIITIIYVSSRKHFYLLQGVLLCIYQLTYIRRHISQQLPAASYQSKLENIVKDKMYVQTTPMHNCNGVTSEPFTMPTYCPTSALPEEPIGNGTGPTLWRGACPKQGAAARHTRSHGTCIYVESGNLDHTDMLDIHG